MPEETMRTLTDLPVAARGLKFPEGPIAMADGTVLVVEIRRGTLSRITPDGRIDVVAEVGGGPNGAAMGPDGAVYVCNNGGMEFHDVGALAIPGHAPAGYRGGSIQRVEPKSGKVTTLYAACAGRTLRGPNDIVFDRQGGFWFTDYGKSDDQTIDRGIVYYALPDGSKIVEARRGFIGPNGIGLSADEKTLYVAETLTSRLWALEIDAPGTLKPADVPWMPGRLVAALPWFQMLDSLKLDSSGRICVAGGPRGGITVFTPDGSFEHRELVPAEIIVTNLCFGGKDGCDVWITESGTGQLFKTRWDVPGLTLNFSV
jgi:gluconolactonase